MLSNRVKFVIATVVAIIALTPIVVSLFKTKPAPAGPAQTQPSVPSVTQAPAFVDDPAVLGSWTSVDFVKSMEDFVPGKQAWTGDLFLKGVEFKPDGVTSGPWQWSKGTLWRSDDRTLANYVIKTIDGAQFLFMEWISGDVTIRGMKPNYYVLRRASGETQSSGRADIRSDSATRRAAAESDSFQTVRPVASVAEFDDVRWKDLRSIDFAGRDRLAATLTFNQATLWPNSIGDKAPTAIVAAAMNPGLGIGGLHHDGITGQGVNVAIIDQPLFTDHPEFAGKIAAYRDMGCGTDNSMHGPAVTSLLVGAQCGTAPGAKVFYAAAPSWLKDAAYYAKALDWVREQNRGLSANEKIRVVSVSAAPSGAGSPFQQNQAMWDEACAAAEAEGIMVLDCTQHRRWIGPCYFASDDREQVSQCRPGYPGRPNTPPPGQLLVPCSPRTLAEEYTKGECGYQYNGRGGLSWTIPYCAGVLALGWQVKPDLSNAAIRELLLKSAYVDQSGATFIQPAEFIRRVASA